MHGETLPIDKPDMFVFTNREPLGVVAAVIPWNSQMFLSGGEDRPSAGRWQYAIVLKASEHASAPYAGIWQTDRRRRAFLTASINIVTGHADPCGKALTSHPLDSADIAFTGGPIAASACHSINSD